MTMMRFTLGSGVINAMQLDDKSVRAAHGGLSFISDKRNRYIVEGDTVAVRALVDEMEMIASSQWDLPFSLRGACGRVAKSLREAIRRATLPTPREEGR